MDEVLKRMHALGYYQEMDFKSRDTRVACQGGLVALMKPKGREQNILELFEAKLDIVI